MDVTNAGLFTTAVGANLTVGNDFVQNGAGSNLLGGNIDSTTAGVSGISFLRAVTLQNGITMSTGLLAGDNILFSSTLDGTTALTESLGLTTGAGDITFNLAVGNTTALGDVTVTSAGTVLASDTFNAASYTQSAGSVSTTFADLVTLSGAFDFIGQILNIN